MRKPLNFLFCPFMRSWVPLDHGYASSITFKDLSPWHFIFLYILSFRILLATNSIFETLWVFGYDIFKENYWERKVFNVARETPGRHISIHRDSFSGLWSECYFFHQQWWNPLPPITKGTSWETQGQMAKVLRTIEVEDEKTERDKQPLSCSWNNNKSTTGRFLEVLGSSKNIVDNYYT